MANELYQHFPLLTGRLENGHRLAYLDSAATTQKPQAVIDAVQRYYLETTANPHRGAYALSAEATALYEGARQQTARFIGAESENQIIFTRNATDALNLVALGWAANVVQPGDDLLVAVSEHHSNYLPWQALAGRTGANLIQLHTDSRGQITAEELERKITDRTRLVAVAQISNVLGSVNPISLLSDIAHRHGAMLVMDGAQSVPHIPVDVRQLGVDFMAFSGHKMLGPAGIGVLYASPAAMAQTQAVIYGGGMVDKVTPEQIYLPDGPQRFEAGTPNVEAAVGLSAAMTYLEQVGFDRITTIEQELTAYLLEGLSTIDRLTVYGSHSPQDRTGIVAFNLDGVHPHDVASIVDAEGVAIRAGHHCAQPLMGYLDIQSCCRASVYLYNTREDIDQLIRALDKVRRWFT